MLSEFLVYLQLGFDHIVDWRAYDHLLFVATLTVSYRIETWKPLLVLITAFTIGHSVTLVLATTNLLRLDPVLIEILIPVTIVLASVVNVFEAEARIDTRAAPDRARLLKYGIALGFGLVHGLGFSNFLRAALGAEEHIALPLFSFNVGLELGQILIVALLLALGAAIVRPGLLGRRAWIILVSTGTAASALFLLFGQLAA